MITFEKTSLQICAAVLAIIPLLVLVFDIWIWLHLPPGPLPLPFIGNKFDLPSKKPWLKFQEWSKKYGPIFTIWVGRHPTLVVSDPIIATELMEKRSDNYSSRPRFVVLGEIYSKSGLIMVQPYGKDWSTRRRLLHQGLSPKALVTYQKRQEAEASRLLCHIRDEVDTWEREIERFTSSIAFSISYGHRVDSPDAKVIRERLGFMQYMASLSVPGAYLVESIPILQYLPNIVAPWKNHIEYQGKQQVDANVALLNLVQQEVEEAKKTGLEIPSSLTQIILSMREEERIRLSDRELSFIPASLFSAGSDSTASAICTAILGLVSHTHVLHAAQAEIDRVVGTSRTPCFADERNLPYMRALCKEALRWRPVAVMGGIPHASCRADTYRGWSIPRGTTIIGNSWAITQNKAYYPVPDNFDPGRFLEESHDSNERPNLTKCEQHAAFGWGRRICPGAGLAKSSIFIALAKMIWAFDILPLDGVMYDTFAYTEASNIRPRPFKCVIRIKDEHRRRVLTKERKEAEVVMEKFPAFN